MADVMKYAALMFAAEGGFSNDPNDAGGATNMGVTLGTWRDVGNDLDGDGDIDSDDLKLMTREDVASKVLKPHYWDRWQADRIRNQSVANLLVDWLYNSGTFGIRIPQRILGVREDGIVGPDTLGAVNAADQKRLFNSVMDARKKYYKDLVIRKPSQSKFLRGWLNRLAGFTFED